MPARAPQTSSPTLDAVETPALVLDRVVMTRNVARFAEHARRLGVRLRPHVKTPKCLPIARLLADHGAEGFTTSTLREAEALADGGFDDLFYAVPLDRRKVARAARLLRRGVRMSFLIDTLDGARAAADAADREGVVLDFWIEIDVDHYRTGVDPASAEFEAIARLLQDRPSTRLRGLMSYGGASYNSDGPEAAAALAETHRLALLAARERLEACGVTCPELSFGSGPAVQNARSMQGITEVRAGIHIFQDLFQAGIGACRVEDVAVSVLASVISIRRDLNRVVVDAGGLALSKDRSTAGRAFDAGFGLVRDARTGELLDDVYVSAVSQELGLLTTRSGAPLPFERLAIGEQVRILPNHADMTAAAYPGYLVVDGDTQVSGYWSRCNFW